MKRANVCAMASLSLCAAMLAGCGGGSGSGTGGGGSGEGLVGIWKTDIGSIISENPLLVTATGQGTCAGPVVLTFQANGTFKQTLDGSCSFPGGASGAISVNASGNYQVSDTEITITNAVNTGVYAAGGISQSFSLVTDGAAKYSLSGDSLVLQPATERGVQQTYSRGS
ncbi:MAG: hypothetical protein KDF54_14825 [Hydrogenophaga sp.]|nr:hypothetical protein [Hydrogenophaga sp.]